MINNSKSVGDQINSERSSWNFKGDTASKFEAHVSRSIPGYYEGHEIIASLSDFFLTKENSKLIDIGSSTGTLIKKLYKRHNNKSCTFIGVDPVQEMCQIAQSNLPKNEGENIKFCKSDFLDYEVNDKVSIYISYYTMQFIHTSVRQVFIDKIYETLDWGGAFFVFEKIRAPDARFQDYMTQVYNDFKVRNMYSIDEIYKKTESIRGVLEPFSEDGNIDLFKRAGFKDYVTIYHNICFRGWLLIK